MTPTPKPDAECRQGAFEPASSAAWVRRLAAVKAKFAVLVLVGALILGAVVWLKGKVLPEDAVRTARSIPTPVRSSSAPLGPRPEHHLAAGLFTGSSEWLGLHSLTEAERHFKPKSRLERVVHADDAKQARRFHRGLLDPDASDGRYTILSMTSIRDDEYLNAAFLRMEDTAEPIRLTDPAGALMVYTSLPAWPQGTLMVARVDAAGAILWTADTGIDRFKLEQILPDPDRVAFVGTRPPVPGKVSEPLLVMVDNCTGRVTTTSLWQ